MQFSERLKAIMEERGMSKQAVAGEIGVTARAVEYWMRSKRTPRADYVVALALLFGVSTDWLLGMDRLIRWMSLGVD